MSKEVYIVTHGDYSDYRIEEVFDDLGLAKAYCKKRNPNGEDGIPILVVDGIITFDFSIETWEICTEEQ